MKVCLLFFSCCHFFFFFWTYANWVRKTICTGYNTWLFFISGALTSIYNFPVHNSLNAQEITAYAEEIYQNQNNAFRMQMSFGFIMYNSIQDRYRYFIPEDNSGYFESPFRFSTVNDLHRFHREIATLDVFETICKQKPSSAWKPVLLTNIRFAIFKTNFPLGSSVSIPDFIKDRKCIVSKIISRYSEKNQNLCLFMSLSYSRHGIRNFISETHVLFQKWIDFAFSKKLISHTYTPDDYPGFDLKHIPYFEELFQVNVNIYELNESSSVVTIFKSMSKHTETLNLNHYQAHLFPITHMNAYLDKAKFQCRNCNRLFDKIFNMTRHEKNCSDQTVYNLPGGFVEQPKTVFQSLSEYGIYVDQKERFCDHVAVYDIECALEKIDESGGENIKFNQLHNPISVAICSNVEGYTEPEVIIDPIPEQLVKKLVSKLNEISKKASELTLQRLSWVKEKLENLMEKHKPKERMKRKLTNTPSPCTTSFVDDCEAFDSNASPSDSPSSSTGPFVDDSEAFESNEPSEPPSKRFRLHLKKENVFRSFIENLTVNDRFSVEYNNWDETEISDGGESEHEELEEDEEEEKNESEENELSHTQLASKLMYNNLKEIYGKFMKFVNQLPVCNYNGSGYDNKCLRPWLVKELNLNDPSSWGFVIKQGNKYTCMSNENLKLIDVSRYLAAGVSYSKFLKSYGIEESKSFLPYSYITDVEVLNETQLPSLESGAWFSEIKGKCVLEEDGVSAEENFKKLEQIWRENDMKCLRDLLIYYSNLDVRPLVKGCIKLRDFYRQFDICAFTSSISLPGLAQQLLYKEAFKVGATFPLPGKYDGEFFNKIKRSLTAGPSIIFSRNVEIGKTKIGNETVKQIVGYDANSLYLSEINKNQPQGMWVKYEKDENQDKLIPQKRDKFLLEKIWLEYLEKEENLTIKHKFNSNSQTRVGPYLVDATIINPPGGAPVKYADVEGCYYHGHPIRDPNCPLVSLENKDEKFKKNMQMRSDRTEKRSQYIQSLGFEHVVYTECYIRNQIKINPKFADFYYSYLPKFYAQTRGRNVTENEIIESIKSGTFFGFAEVSMKTPEHFSESSPYRDLGESPDEFYGRFPPFFLNTIITKDMYSDVMKEYCTENNIPMHDKKMLVSALKVEDGFFSTSLIKWYLDHDFEISSLNYAVEFVSKPAFRNFASQVTKARRMGDVRPELLVQGLAMKTLG